MLSTATSMFRSAAFLYEGASIQTSLGPFVRWYAKPSYLEVKGSRYSIANEGTGHCLSNHYPCFLEAFINELTSLSLAWSLSEQNDSLGVFHVRYLYRNTATSGIGGLGTSRWKNINSSASVRTFWLSWWCLLFQLVPLFV